MASATNGHVSNFERSDSDVTDPIENIDSENGGKQDKYEEINLKEVPKNNGSVSENHLLSARTVRQISNMEEEAAREKKRVSLLKQCSAVFRQGDQRYTKESLHKIFQDYFLLERIFQLFDVENKEHLVQEDLIEYLKERLGEEKQLEFVEQVESVAYVLCGDGVITLPAFQKILQNKVVTNKLLRVIDSDNDGYCTADDIMEFLTGVTSSRYLSSFDSNFSNQTFLIRVAKTWNKLPGPRVGFDRESVEHLEKLFRETVGDQKEITRDQFKKIVVSKNPFFTERVFQIFDVDDSGAISLPEFLDAVQRFAGHAPDDKIRFLFKVYDLDGDGLIQHRELQHVLRACMEENGMQFNDLQLLQLTAAIMQDAAGGSDAGGSDGGSAGSGGNADGGNAITFSALRDQLHRHCGLRDNLTISIDRWLVPPKQAPKPTLLQRLATLKPHQFSRHYIRNNLVFVIHLLLFFGINLGLFISRCYEYRDTNGYLMVARGCGQCLNFSSSYILLPMLRGCATSLRGRGAGSVLPLDALRELHIRAAVLALVASVAHTAAHVARLVVYVIDDPSQNPLGLSLWEWLLTSRPKVLGAVPGCANPTGVALAVILAVMFVCSRPFVRRTGCFEIFYWTHLLYVPFWLLLLFHAPNFWKWFLIPGLLYTGERILRLIWLRSNRGKTYISSGIVLPSRVTHLVIKRPPHFDYCAGDYAFVNIPTVARYEWHPFTISSAPEQEDYLWLHIRGVGEWTNRLYAYFEEQQARLHAGELPAHSQVTRTISGQSNKSTKNKKEKTVEFSPHSYSNNGFTGEEGKAVGPSTLLSPLRLLEKSHSMPNVHNKEKKRNALVAMRDYHRSESEHSFDVCQLSLSPSPQDLSKAYKSPQNRALAHSFRYMRNKPTIIAFKTPSMEDCERRRSNESIITLARRRLSKSISPDKDVEQELPADASSHAEASAESFENYPVGKPLETKIEMPIHYMKFFGREAKYVARPGFEEEIYIDGPYGAPSSHIFRASHAVLVAAGIGVTPFAAILQSVMLRYWRAARRCANCGARATPDAIGGMALKKVDFFWINREQRSFEWFVSLLSQLEIEQAELGSDTERFLEMHMYITSALQKTDMKAVGLQLALDLLHEKEKRDLITGLKTRTNAGRPNWDKVFQQLQEQNKGKVTVFFCGPPQLAKILRKKCAQFNFQFKKEVF